MKIKMKRPGFTLVEVMVSTALSVIIAFTVFAVLRAGDAQSQTAQVQMILKDSAREGLYKMIQEIRQSAPDRVSIGAGNATIQFNIPDPANAVTADFHVDWADSFLIEYRLGGLNNSQILRTNLTTNQITIMANDVVGVLFAGNQANPTLVTVTMNVQRRLLNGRLLPFQPLQMSAQAEIRNH